MILSFARVASKKVMDINYLSPYKIICFIGIIGVFFTLIILIFASTISCGPSSGYCNLKKYYEKKNTTYSYLDNIPIYFSDMKNVYFNKHYKDFYIEIFIVIPLYLIASFGYFFLKC